MIPALPIFLRASMVDMVDSASAPVVRSSNTLKRIVYRSIGLSSEANSST